MRTLAEALAEHRGISLQGGFMWCTCGARLWSQRTGFTAGKLPMHGSVGETAHIHHVVAVVAEWLTSDEAYEVACAEFHGGVPDPGSILAALAAHAKGETDE